MFVLLICFQFDTVVHDATQFLDAPHLEGDGVLPLVEVLGVDVEGIESVLSALHGTAVDAAVVRGADELYLFVVDPYIGTGAISGSCRGDGQAEGLLVVLVEVKLDIPLTVLRLSMPPSQYRKGDKPQKEDIPKEED